MPAPDQMTVPPAPEPVRWIGQVLELAWSHAAQLLVALTLVAAAAWWHWLRRRVATEHRRELPSLPGMVGRLLRLVVIEERRSWKATYLAGELVWWVTAHAGLPSLALRVQLGVLVLLAGRCAYVSRRRARVFAEMFKQAAEKCRYPRSTRTARGADLERRKWVRIHRWVNVTEPGLHTVRISPEMNKGKPIVREDFEREWAQTVATSSRFRFDWQTNADAAAAGRVATPTQIRVIPVADMPRQAPWPGPLSEPPRRAWRDPAPLGEEAAAWLRALRTGAFPDGTRAWPSLQGHQVVWPFADLWDRLHHGVPAFPAEQLWRKFALGVTLGGEIVFWDPIECPHMLVAGPNNTGKSNIERLLVLQALERRDSWRVLGFDPLAVELSWLEGLPGVELLATSLEEIAEGIKRLLAEIQKRQALCEAAGVNNFLELRKPPPALLAVFDEVTVLLAKTGGKSPEAKAIDALKDWMALKLAAIALMGRKFGVYLVPATQRPDVSLGFLGALKAQLHARFATAYMDSTASRMVLDNTRATLLPDSDKFPGRSLAQFDSRHVVLQAYFIRHGDALQFVEHATDSGPFQPDAAAAAAADAAAAEAAATAGPAEEPGGPGTAPAAEAQPTTGAPAEAEEPPAEQAGPQAAGGRPQLRVLPGGRP